jgi:hypothetical protein
METLFPCTGVLRATLSVSGTLAASMASTKAMAEVGLSVADVTDDGQAPVSFYVGPGGEFIDSPATVPGKPPRFGEGRAHTTTSTSRTRLHTQAAHSALGMVTSPLPARRAVPVLLQRSRHSLNWPKTLSPSLHWQCAGPLQHLPGRLGALGFQVDGHEGL